MTFFSRLFGRMMKLPPAETRKIVVKCDLKVPMPDGVELLADHYYPRGDSKPPTVLVRSPYDRRIFFGLLYERLFAERGFQTLIQKSINICDGIIRLVPGKFKPESDGSIKVVIDLWPRAHCFLRKHRIRLQVSSGAHPRFVRNFGTGEPLATATKLIVANQSVYHDPTHPSSVILPIMD